MSRLSLFASVLLLLLPGCASTPTAATAVPGPVSEIRIEQLPDSEFVVEQKGAVSISYLMTVRNTSAEPVKLRMVEMQAVGRSPYVLRNTPATLDETIEPGAEKTVTFSMWAVPQERSRKGDLVWLRGTATFESAAGTYRKAFEQSFAPPK